MSLYHDNSCPFTITTVMSLYHDNSCPFSMTSYAPFTMTSYAPLPWQQFCPFSMTTVISLQYEYSYIAFTMTTPFTMTIVRHICCLSMCKPIYLQHEGFPVYGVELSAGKLDCLTHHQVALMVGVHVQHSRHDIQEPGGHTYITILTSYFSCSCIVYD